MKHGKNPTRKQKILMKKRGLNPEHWLIVKNLPREIHITHRETGTLKIINL